MRAVIICMHIINCNNSIALPREEQSFTHLTTTTTHEWILFYVLQRPVFFFLRYCLLCKLNWRLNLNKALNSSKQSSWHLQWLLEQGKCHKLNLLSLFVLWYSSFFNSNLWTVTEIGVWNLFNIVAKRLLISFVLM